MGRCNGKRSSVKGTAYKADPNSDEAKLKVKLYVPPFYPIFSVVGDYRILSLDDDYNYALIGEPRRWHLWEDFGSSFQILCRQTYLDDEIYNQLVEKAKGEGYNVSKLRRTPQASHHQREKRTPTTTNEFGGLHPFLKISTPAANITASINSIPMLNGTNFKAWQESKEMEKWEKSNHISLMVIKRAILKAFRGTMSNQVDTAKAFLEDLEKRFAKNEKAETSTILAKLISMRYTGKGNIREYIMEISDLASKLKALKLDLSEDLLVHLVLISLLAQFSQLKEEDRLKPERTPSAHLASTTKDKRKDNKRKKKKEAVKTALQKKQHKEPTQDGCFFCGAAGHKKKQCTNYHACCAKNGNARFFEDVEFMGEKDLRTLSLKRNMSIFL
ncbi:hypothetical protein GH714_011564 [Hevea brasiliensis]|uniref:CCHC-type domain-containing protein n=1 Tax=Hevea brasiliensis TaxID=3981 RepID=A0A6A6MXH9_HEVBR|nr:hypothetical protein GH714_011564 [Hevea brasiliensis]